MKVIGAGFPRTGTMSLQDALGTLGFKAYHMAEAVKNYHDGDTDKWNALFEGNMDVDWDQIFGNYDATTDTPGFSFYKELMETYPDAKVVLTERDPENWATSLEKLYAVGGNVQKKLDFIPRFRAYGRLSQNWKRKMFGEGIPDRETMIAAFKRHNEAVKTNVPAERLLVYRVQDGWGPLCEFLGVPVPNEPFPHLNKGEDLGKTAQKELLPLLVKDAGIIAAPYIAGAAAVIVLLFLLF